MLVSSKTRGWTFRDAFDGESCSCLKAEAQKLTIQITTCVAQVGKRRQNYRNILNLAWSREGSSSTRRCPKSLTLMTVTRVLPTNPRLEQFNSSLPSTNTS